MTSEQAETISLQALGWLLSQDELRDVFMGSTGLGVDDLKEAAGEPSFLAGVMDFILSSDETVMAFCDALGLDYATPGLARAHLPGQSEPHWT